MPVPSRTRQRLELLHLPKCRNWVTSLCGSVQIENLNIDGLHIHTQAGDLYLCSILEALSLIGRPVVSAECLLATCDYYD